MQHIDDIEWVKLSHGDSIRSEIKNEMYKYEITSFNVE